MIYSTKGTNGKGTPWDKEQVSVRVRSAGTNWIIIQFFFPVFQQRDKVPKRAAISVTLSLVTFRTTCLPPRQPHPCILDTPAPSLASNARWLGFLTSITHPCPLNKSHISAHTPNAKWGSRHLTVPRPIPGIFFMGIAMSNGVYRHVLFFSLCATS